MVMLGMEDKKTQMSLQDLGTILAVPRQRKLRKYRDLGTVMVVLFFTDKM